MNKKVIVSTLAISALAVNVFAQGSNLGPNGTANGDASLVIGTNNTTTTNATSAFIAGTQNTVSAPNGIAFGTNNTVSGENGFAGGNDAKASGRNSFAFGSKARTGAGGVAQYNRQLQNVSAGRVEADSLDAVNGSQLFAAYDEINNLGAKVRTNTADISTLQNTSINHETRITNLENRQYNLAGEINNRINATDQRINRLGASSAALAGLHPLDFNRSDKVSYAVSYGHYRNSNAVALGAFIRPNERLMIGVGATLGAENQYTINLAFKTGKGSDYLAEAKDAQSRISKLERLVDELTQEVAAQRRI